MVDYIDLFEKTKKIPNSVLCKNRIPKNITTTNSEESIYEILFDEFKKRIGNYWRILIFMKIKKCFVCLLDYEFSEIRRDVNTKAENPDSMTGEEIKNKFHLLNKQIKQKKGEVCRQCYQTGKRGIAFGIHYFYKGNEDWDSEIPIKGKAAELGCEGCVWYDFAEWRKHLLEVLQNNKLINIL